MTETTPNNLPLKKTHPFNLVIIGQFVRFGPREFPGLSKAEFFGGSAATLLITVTVTVLLQNALGERLQALPGTAQNVLMSALFLAMLSSRHSLRGQSLTIAVNKMIGSAFGCTAIVLGINLYETTQRQNTPLLATLTAVVIILDATYVVAVVRMRRSASAPTPVPERQAASLWEQR